MVSRFILRLSTSIILMLLFSSATWAFGKVDLVSGNAIAINADGQSRALTEGGRVEVGDELSAGKNSEILIITDDQGLVLIRPETRLVIEDYRAKGNQQDVLAIKLLKGALRSVTGFIGKTAPKNYRITTTTATIGIRGTDHEITVVEQAGEEIQPGTYSKVNTGEVYMSNKGVTIDLKAGQFGLVQKTGLPQLLDTEPKGLFKAGQLDARLEKLKPELGPEAALKAKEALQKSAGGTDSSGELKIPKGCGLNTPAQRALDEFFKAYEAGDVALVQRRLDPKMIGYGAFLNSMLQDINNQKQIRFLLQDRNAQCGTDLASINFRWEKRFLDLITFKPQLLTGQTSVLLYLKGNEWRLSGITGDNPFAPSLSSEGALLAVIPAQFSYSSLPQACGPGPTSTLSGTASATVPILSGPPNNPTCNQFTVPSCNIAGFFGTVISSNLSCTGAPPTATVYNASGSTAFSSTGPALSAAVVSQVIPVSGSQGGETASGTVTCQANITYPTGAPVCAVASGSIPVQLQLKSGSQANAGSAQVEATTGNGDREIFILTESTPGTFTLNAIPIGGGNAMPGNGRIDLKGPTSITLRFADPRTGALSRAQFNITP